MDTRDKQRTLTGKRLLLGITGGIAAYKSAELARLLVKAGAEVTVVMTAAAQRFVTPATMQALSGRKVHVELWDDGAADSMAHISLSREADAIVIAPATANFMAKLAHGLADDLLSTTCLARQIASCPLLLAPAMNREMWDNPTTQRNKAQLVADGVTVLGPGAGEQACREVGFGRMLEPTDIIDKLYDYFERRWMTKPLAGVKALVTAGPTHEPIDAVRAITNASSGKMGYAIAASLQEAGARVTLVSGPTSLTTPSGVDRINIQTASQMLDAVIANLDDVKFFFAVAAVADYTPAEPQTNKIKKSNATLSITLVPTIDILASVASRINPPFCVGFAAESDNVVDHAAKKRQIKNIPMIVANHAGSAIGADDNTITIIDGRGTFNFPRAPKLAVAALIVAHAVELFLSASHGSAKSLPSVGSLRNG